MRAQLGIRVSGFDAPKPVQSFEQCGFDSALLTVIKKAGYALQSSSLSVHCCGSDSHLTSLYGWLRCWPCRYQKPTAIQAQALPAALSGRDILVRSSPCHILLALSAILYIDVLCVLAHPLLVMNWVVAGHRQDRVWENCRLCAAYAGSHHGPARTREGRGTHWHHSSSYQRALRADPQGSEAVQQALQPTHLCCIWGPFQV